MQDDSSDWQSDSGFLANYIMSMKDKKLFFAPCTSSLRRYERQAMTLLAVLNIFILLELHILYY